MQTRLRQWRDIPLYLVLLFGMSGLLVYVRSQPWGSPFQAGAPAPGLLPTVAIIGGLVALCGGLLQALAARRPADASSGLEIDRSGESLLLEIPIGSMIVACAVYVGIVWSFVALGLIVGPTVMAFVASAALSVSAGVRHVRHVCGVGAASALIVNLFFIQILDTYVRDPLLF